MKREEIHWGDWHRILLGQAPVEFLLEVLVRTVIIYLMLLLTLRLMGKRMGGQLTVSELSVMLTLGAIVSVPMQMNERGILQGILVLICALVFQRGLTYLSVKNAKIAYVTEGHESIIIKDGILLFGELQAMKISREQIFAMLRSQGIYNLGEVRRVYLEACGIFSVFKYPEPKPGLSLLPFNNAGTEDQLAIDRSVRVCEKCGQSAKVDSKNEFECDNCGANKTTLAVTLRKS